MKKFYILVLSFTLSMVILSHAQVTYPGNSPGRAIAKTTSGNQLVLQNKVIKMNFVTDGKNITLKSFENKAAKKLLNLADVPLFELTLPDSSVVTSNEFEIKIEPVISTIPADSGSPILANQSAGKKVGADFENHKLGLKVHWEAILRDGSNYIRQIFTFTARDSVKISGITLIKIQETKELKVMGIVDGSPLVYKNMFFAFEHPMSRTKQSTSFSAAFLSRQSPLTSAAPLTVSSVWGIAPENQLRRGFLYYAERERAHPYRQMLNYNTWFDISWVDRILNDSVCLDRVKVFNDSLITKRNVKINAFLFDDGWDDYKTLWQFHSGFPDGFKNLKKACDAVGARLGTWLSPWGGYDIRKPQRLEFGKKQVPPFETNENGFTLTGPVYYKRFKEVTENLITKYGVSLFKFDGVGAGNGSNGAGIAYQNDIESFLKLLTDLRKMEPDIYLSLTIGTWPSVYWLKYGDAIFRAGEDTGLQGKGSKRQQWTTYRDAEVYKNIVMRAPLYPLNSVVSHGICIANHGLPGTLEMNDSDIADEIWSFFGSGTGMQEMYINPHKLNTAHWDCLAKAINWARKNKAAMVDVHWIGGDPAKEEVYGYAGWTPEKAYLMLRNPSSETQTFDFEAGKVFQLPKNANGNYEFFDARTAKSQPLEHGKTFRITLKPFEVKVFDAIPLK